MAKIELFYGWPTTPEREENIEEWIYDCDINLETAVFLKFKSLVNSLSQKNEASDNYFELVVTSITGAQVNFAKNKYRNTSPQRFCPSKDCYAWLLSS
jgi:hypothetical protein